MGKKQVRKKTLYTHKQILFKNFYLFNYCLFKKEGTITAPIECELNLYYDLFFEVCTYSLNENYLCKQLINNGKVP